IIANGDQTKWSTIEVDGKIEFQCQHDALECFANKIHSCAIEFVKDPLIQLKYIACMIADNMVPDEVEERCARELNIDYLPIAECSKNIKGSQLLKMYGERTNSLQPPVKFIPTIELNDSQNTIAQPAILKGLHKSICEVFQNPTILPLKEQKRIKRRGSRQCAVTKKRTITNKSKKKGVEWNVSEIDSSPPTPEKKKYQKTPRKRKPVKIDNNSEDKRNLDLCSFDGFHEMYRLDILRSAKRPDQTCPRAKRGLSRANEKTTPRQKFSSSGKNPRQEKSYNLAVARQVALEYQLMQGITVNLF
ncbi:GILT-like protein 1, partial [Gonioctena quinquepunctata]